MRALIRTGPAEDLSQLVLDEHHPEPIAKDHAGDYIVQIKAAALTREELTWPEPLEPEVPMPGYDFAGIVISVPENHESAKFKLGDEVYGMTSPPSKPGNAREIAVFSEKELCLKPTNLSWEDAAAVPLSALTAWQGLFTHGKLNQPRKGGNEGKRVLVTAASGGVGIWATQLARQAGVQVVATCGSSNIEFVKSLGADTILDYNQTNLLSWVNEDWGHRTFDVILDCIGGQTLTEAWKCTRRNGIVISVAEPAEPKRPSMGVAEGVQCVWFIVDANPDQLQQITALIEEARAHGKVDSTFPLEGWRDAFERLEGGHAKGKVVLAL